MFLWAAWNLPSRPHIRLQLVRRFYFDHKKIGSQSGTGADIKILSCQLDAKLSVNGWVSQIGHSRQVSNTAVKPSLVTEWKNSGLSQKMSPHPPLHGFILLCLKSESCLDSKVPFSNLAFTQNRLRISAQIFGHGNPSYINLLFSLMQILHQSEALPL